MKPIAMLTPNFFPKPNLFFLPIFVVLGLFCHAQPVVKTVEKNQLPKGVKYEGEIVNAVKWNDAAGEHLVVLTETGTFVSDKFKHENDGDDAELFAYHFEVKNQTAVQTWRVFDYVHDCPGVDILAEFIPGAFQVTDLDKNGVSEIWLMYKYYCKGDYSPSALKIIMYQGAQKYAMRGETRLKKYNDDGKIIGYDGGDYKFDNAFLGAPPAITEFAKSMWKKNMDE